MIYNIFHFIDITNIGTENERYIKPLDLRFFLGKLYNTNHKHINENK